MGQQQLLLLVLTTIIDGLASLAGIQAFSVSQRQSAINHMTQKSIEIASDVQEYAQRPDFIHPENTTGNTDLVIDFGELPHYETDDSDYGGDHVDPYATYSLNGNSTLPDGYNEDACPDNNPVNTVEAYSEEHDVSVCVSITGTSPDDLEVGVAE
jgi:hypothetical protein